MPLAYICNQLNNITQETRTYYSMTWLTLNDGKVPCALLFQGIELDLPLMHPWYEKGTALTWQSAYQYLHQK